MTKRYLKVTDGSGPIQFPGGYPANDGEVAVLDDEEPRLQEYFDYPATKKSFREALEALVDAGKVIDYGTLAEIGAHVYAHSVRLPLADVAAGEVASFTPGFAGRVIGISALATADATTANKAASLGLEIASKRGNNADGIVTLTRTGSPTGGDFDAEVTVGDDDPVDVEGITYNSTVGALQALIDATDLAGKVTVGGVAGAWTLTAPDSALSVSVDSSGLTGGTSPAVTPSTTQTGGGARVVGASGNPATLDLTSANVGNGGVVAGETIATGSNTNYGNFVNDDAIVLKASGVTAFVEGEVVVTTVLLRTDD